jgi:hypothetical protein
LRRRGRQLADINLADVPLVLVWWSLGRGRISGQQQSESGQSNGWSHSHIERQYCRLCELVKVKMKKRSGRDSICFVARTKWAG